ncbi:MAG: hypothetical protein UX10_C0004G0041 [Candidatus Magasanikbacteria bacterium GW2011_GWA2_45_39]|uniref:Uncharacterized protein n=1 Tax=Candidatus Magasanikbacteria bacterium GW2011_GWA2_45_39 TaxID=1619041 RepID=A0A0G1PR27_9BACT|nr:MAG: hypothetical protein UX10_C0004G0041 [Candidatus Magasanikbacteria bacterium GW2011_GWA2_45_39]
MKNYSRKKSTPGKTAYRTPSRVRANRSIADRAIKAKYFATPIKGQRPDFKN